MSKTKIMIVEDEWAIAEELKQSLKNLDYDVTAIEETGDGAIRRAGKDRPDLVFMDINLKGKMNGIDAAGQIKSKFNIPHIFITAYADKDKLDQAKVTEPFGYLIKPYNELELNASTKMALYKHKMEMRVREAEEALRHSHDKLEVKVKERTRDLREANIALTVLLKKRDHDKKRLEEQMLANSKQLILPYIEKLKRTTLTENQRSIVNIVDKNLTELTSPFIRSLSSKFLKLTPAELKVANLVRHGMATKEIAAILNLSIETINNHRKHIRKKSGITNKKANLRTILSSFSEPE